MTPAESTARRTRRRDRRDASSRPARASIEDAKAQRRRRPLTPLTLMSSVARVLPANVAVVEEAVTTTGTYLGATRRTQEHDRLFRPSRLGPGMGSGLRDGRATRLARTSRAGPLGRGGVDVWHSRAMDRGPLQPARVVRDLQQRPISDSESRCSADRSSGGAAADISSAWTWPSRKSTLSSLAQSLGVKALRITDPDELETRLQESFAGDGPRLFDVPVERGSLPRLNYG